MDSEDEGRRTVGVEWREAEKEGERKMTEGRKEKECLMARNVCWTCEQQR